MSELETLREWFEFNDRARSGYLDVFARLPPEELRRDRGASYPSLLDILTHSVDAINMWTVRSSAVLGTVYPGVERPGDPGLPDVREYERGVLAQTSALLGALSESDLARTILVPKRVPWFPEDRVLTVRTVLWHLVEEELQHRGELNALLWQLDVDAPVYDWIDWVQRPQPKEPRASTG